MSMQPAERLTYADVGVDVDIEAQAANILYQASKRTWANRTGRLGEVHLPFDHFAGLRYIRMDNLPAGTVMYGGSDGIATKAEFAERAQRFDTVAFDLLAMLCDDAAIRGGEPVAIKSVLAVNTLGQNRDRLPYIEQLGKGLVAAAAVAGVAVINGEIAQHNDRMGALDKFVFDWSGDVTWFAHESRLITGREVRPGDYLVGLKEDGLRCNGISLIRRVLRDTHGESWEDEKLGEQRLVDLALHPSRIYSPALVDMVGGWSLDRQPKAQLHGAAHISGGGIPEKLGRALTPSGYGAIIDNPFPPCDLILYCQEKGNVSDENVYKALNMGQGMVLITPSPGLVMNVALDHGIKSQVIGTITQQPGIVIHSKGLHGGIVAFS